MHGRHWELFNIPSAGRCISGLMWWPKAAQRVRPPLPAKQLVASPLTYCTPTAPFQHCGVVFVQTLDLQAEQVAREVLTPALPGFLFDHHHRRLIHSWFHCSNWCQICCHHYSSGRLICVNSQTGIDGRARVKRKKGIIRRVRQPHCLVVWWNRSNGIFANKK